MNLPYRPTPTPILGALSALALLATAACDIGAVKEGVELALEGGVIELRETPRTPRGAPRVLVFGLDGIGYEVLKTALADGSLPRLAALTGAAGADPDVMEHAYLAPAVITVLPSITLAAWTTLFTGRPPAETGVPGNEWFDRATNRFHAPAPVSVKGNSDALGSLTEGLLGTWIRTPTLYERADVRAHVSMLHVHRGADLLTVPSATDLVEILAGFPEGVAADDEVDREIYSELDEASAASAIDALEDHGMPDLQVVYFPGVDLFTHAAPDSEAEQRRYLTEILDPAMGRVLDAYAAAGALDGTWVVVMADHGHTPVPADDRHALGVDGEDAPTTILESLGWRLRAPELEVDEDADHQAVVAYQGAFSYVYLADRSTCVEAGTPCAWPGPPRPADVDAVAAAFHARTKAGSLEMVLIPRRAADGSFQGIDRWTDGGARPLASVAVDTLLLRFEERLGWLLDGPAGYLAGDVILMARSGAWVPPEERFYFSHPYHSWHGSAHAADSRIPLLVARAGASGQNVAARVRAALPPRPSEMDVAGLLLSLLERSPEAGGR